MKKIVALLFGSMFVVSSIGADVPSDLKTLFGSNAPIPHFLYFNSGSSIGNVISMNNAVNEERGKFVARSKLFVKDAFYNHGGTVTVGTKTLTGTWAVLGDVDFEMDGQVFKSYAIVRGKLAGTISGAKLTDLDLRGIDFGTTDLSNVDFSFSDLSGARFETANIVGANFGLAFGLTPQQKMDLKNKGAIVDAPNQPDKSELNKKLLDAASNNASLSFLQRLIRLGADINSVNNNDETILMLAVMDNDMPLFRFAIDHNANIHLKKNHGENALILAAIYGNKQMIDSLLDHGAKIDEVNSVGLTALHVTIIKNRLNAFKLLIEKGAQITTTDEDAMTLLMTAAVYGRIEPVQFLLDHGIDHTLKNKQGHVAIEMADEKNHPEIVNLIAKHDLQAVKKICDVDEDCLQKQLDDRLIQALQNKYSLPIIQYYLECGANPNIRFGEGESTPLIQAVLQGNRDLIEVLIGFNCDLDGKNKYGNTALMLASWYNDIETVELLISAGAEFGVKNDHGFTALGLAHQKGHVEIIRLLESAGENRTSKKEL